MLDPIESKSDLLLDCPSVKFFYKFMFYNKRVYEVLIRELQVKAFNWWLAKWCLQYCSAACSVICLLSSDWPRVITWPGYCLLIGCCSAACSVICLQHTLQCSPLQWDDLLVCTVTVFIMRLIFCTAPNYILGQWFILSYAAPLSGW